MTLVPDLLEGSIVRLETTSVEHVAGLTAAASEDRASYAFTHVPSDRGEMRAYVDEALASQAAGRALPFTVVDQRSGAVVGATRFLDLEAFTWPPPWPVGVGRGPSLVDGVAPSVAELGSTWYAASAQGTGVNAEAKLLLLSHAFEVWGSLRVSLKTDARNARSRRAIEKLGARFEGIRRAHAPAIDGSVRDTAYYSIVEAEWPLVRQGLRDRVASLAP